MAITIVNAIDSVATPILLSLVPPAPIFQVDTEIMEVIGPLPPSTQFVPGSGTVSGNAAETFTGAAGLRIPVTNVLIPVKRGANSTQPAPHLAGATVVSLYPVTSSIVTVVTAPPSAYVGPLVFDTTATTGGLYAWTGSAYEKVGLATS